MNKEQGGCEMAERRKSGRRKYKEKTVVEQPDISAAGWVNNDVHEDGAFT